MEILRRENYSAVPFDARVGRSPMVKTGNMVFIGATSSTNVNGDVEGGGDPYRQANIIFKKNQCAFETRRRKYTTCGARTLLCPRHRPRSGVPESICRVVQGHPAGNLNGGS